MILKLYLGDCLEYMHDLSSGSIDLVVTSPPYWNQKKYSFWKTYDDYISDVKKWIGEIARVLKAGRYCFWVIPDKIPWPPKENGTKERLYLPVYCDSERLAAGNGLICEFPIIWLKYQAAQRMFGSYPYPPTIIHTPMTERICVWRKPGKANLERKSDESLISLNDWKVISKDVWQFRAPDNKVHPAEYPIELPTRCIKLWSFVGDTVLDPFCGSGTTGIACEKLGRNFIGCEINSAYYAIAEKRINEAQNKPVLL